MLLKILKYGFIIANLISISIAGYENNDINTIDEWPAEKKNSNSILVIKSAEEALSPSNTISIDLTGPVESNLPSVRTLRTIEENNQNKMDSSEECCIASAIGCGVGFRILEIASASVAPILAHFSSVSEGYALASSIYNTVSIGLPFLCGSSRKINDDDDERIILAKSCAKTIGLVNFGLMVGATATSWMYWQSGKNNFEDAHSLYQQQNLILTSVATGLYGASTIVLAGCLLKQVFKK